MSTWFVYRSVYDSLLERHVRRFDDASVLAWAQRIWRGIEDPDAAYAYSTEILEGLEVTGLALLFTSIAEQNLPLPQTMKAVETGLMWSFGPEGVLSGSDHLQMFAAEDSSEVAVYLFDDHYRRRHPERAEFLVHTGWELPAGDADGPACDLGDLNEYAYLPPGDGVGSVYPVCLAAYRGSANLTDLSGMVARIDGVRVPDLCRYLLLCPVVDGLGTGLSNVRDALRKVLCQPGADAGFLAALRDDPADRATWHAYTDWLLDREQPPAGLTLLDRAIRQALPTELYDGRQRHDRVAVQPHLAQGRKGGEDGLGPRIEEWLFLDDRWLAAQPLLGGSLLRFSTRWDVL